MFPPLISWLKKTQKTNQSNFKTHTKNQQNKKNFIQMVPEFENVTCKTNQTKNLGLTDQRRIPFT